ncbi:MAG: hypothetical protein M3Q57_00680 [Pseudomonadota bacterium]|nr:hypothetical protein [Pseudomonadota bacterium]
MTWKHNTPAGWAWLVFAVINVLAACFNELPKLITGLMLNPDWGLVIPLVSLVSVAGLCQYAVRWRSPRTTTFWRGFAPVMLITWTILLARTYPAAAKVLALSGDAPLRILGVLLVFGVVFVPTAFMAIAVLRLGDYLGPTRRPLGQKPAQLSLNLT